MVLQEQSLRPITNSARMANFADKLCAAIKESGGHPYLYLTWSRQQTPETQSKLTESYENVARETGATIAPVGLACELARTRQPDLILYSADGSHPSSAGSYLAACEPSADLPFRPSFTDTNGKAITLIQVNKKDAIFLQTIADEIMASYEQPFH